MPPVPSLQQWPRGPVSRLHCAARDGSAKLTAALLLSSGSIDVNQGSPIGVTPLMLAAEFGHTRVATILLNKGSNVSIAADEAFTALHFSAQNGHLAVTEMLMEAGADIEAITSQGYSPLHLAAFDGHGEVVRALIDAGTNPNGRLPDGETPLFAAAFNGHMGAVKELLHARANPLLTRIHPSTGNLVVPLDGAAGNGHSEVIRELIQRFGIEGCGGANAGITALSQATRAQHVDVMVLLTDAGVVDTTGRVLLVAVGIGGEASVKFLLQQREGKTTEQGMYVNVCAPFGITPLLATIQGSRSWSPRVARMLVDAGADTTSVIRLPDTPGGKREYTPMPLTYTKRILLEKTLQGKLLGQLAAEEQLHSLEAIRRLLLQVAAVHAVSWLWPSAAPVIGCAAEGTGGDKPTTTPLRRMLPILRRRTERRGVLLAALFRWAVT